MAKTLVVAAHDAGPAVNGHDGCHARMSCGGVCPGVKTAAWLNGLGDDNEQYIKWPSGIKRETNGNVRDNWLRANGHIVAVEPALARLRAEERRLSAELRMTVRKIASYAQQRAAANGGGDAKDSARLS